MASSSNRGLGGSPYTTTASSPIILPPLGHDEKENVKEFGSHSKHKPSARVDKSAAAPAISFTSRPSALTSSNQRSTSTTSVGVSSMSPARVLRYGETVESVFLVHADSTEAYRSLCLQLIHDSDAAQDPSVWTRVVEMAVEQEQRRGKGWLAQSAPDLIRLHRRATGRFPTVTPETLGLWLSYAKVQAHQKRDAVLALRHVSRVGASVASFYLTKADLYVEWGDVDEAKKALQEGINHNASPLEALKAKLSQLSSQRQQQKEHGKDAPQLNNDELCGDDVDDPTERFDNKRPAWNAAAARAPFDIRNTTVEDQSVDSEVKEKAAKGMPTPQSLKQRQHFSLQKSTSAVKGPILLSTTSKRPPLMSSKVLQRSAANIFMNPQRLDSGLAVTEEATKEEGESTVNKNDTPNRGPKIDVSYIKAWDPSQPRRKSTEHAVPAPAPAITSSPATSEVTAVPMAGKATLQPLGEHLTRHAASPSHNKSKLDLSTIKAWQPESCRRKSSENTSKELAPATPNGATVPSAPPESNDHNMPTTARRPKQPLIPRLDLSYMLEWDPAKRRPSMTTEPEKDAEAKASMMVALNEPSTGSVGDDKGGKTEKAAAEIGETEEQPTVTVRAGAASQSSSRKSAEPKTTEKTSKRRRLDHANPDSEKETNSMEGYNKDFLSLARQENMITINGNSYMKIGVIGKGGSCKVYRALSKEGHVLAIKKVKIAGMKKESIEGYANEIALLNRLRGSPAIIQLYDSQIDVPQKAILLVMEAGEADLNHVLHQQTVLAAESSGQTLSHPRLDMNFIRLTWQQMLKAVHCIHEERIVHADLKPANFLFVRGALKLIDFGIAKAIQSDDTTNIYRDSQIGTVNYMSPESLMNNTSDKRIKMGRASDIWSLGCILYQMIYGKTPFADLHLIRKIHAISDPNHQISFPPTVEQSAIDCMRQCLRFNADERPPIVGPNGLLNEHPFLNARR